MKPHQRFWAAVIIVSSSIGGIYLLKKLVFDIIKSINDGYFGNKYAGSLIIFLLIYNLGFASYIGDYKEGGKWYHFLIMFPFGWGILIFKLLYFLLRKFNQLFDYADYLIYFKKQDDNKKKQIAHEILLELQRHPEKEEDILHQLKKLHKL